MANEDDDIEKRLRRWENRWVQMVVGGSVLAASFLTLFGYKDWVEVQTTVQKKIDEEIGAERDGHLKSTHGSAVEMIESWKRISEITEIKNSTGIPLHIVMGEHRLDTNNTKQVAVKRGIEHSIYTDIAMTDEFKAPPTIFTALEGKDNHSDIIGTSSIYLETEKSFRIYLHKKFGEIPIDPDFAASNELKINWIAVGEASSVNGGRK